ncbi:cupredoxin domain-containing protein [Pseudomonas sp. RTC3]|uniref:cupredoxin domain-containing protein n=2 Tax=Pseudomonas TaxID=286 RepID=UPI002AB3B93C|nr:MULTISPECIES: cupredoxin domain-containing protein [unclassified Pseudomonas]MEB0061655.1 cupredoxin domain-containing protein [Pseudomonas sp. RTC3]MDY7565184.1 cupredoxin domain-containing protein [Pseudomonas sp. 5C2]MEB0008508.1 cupredoxin domain-containing protein [Pseudomonas sp. RTB2]MEB0017013.1 cupredoxin domain-containing protein [Pseudomonas sp. RTB3]MEB0028291.1 cupredoxin domain-containing protein [Pseudomonas sp. MH9.2]
MNRPQPAPRGPRRFAWVHPRVVWLILAWMTTPLTAYAELPSYELSLNDGHFIPALLEVPAGQRFKIVLKNIGNGPAEFESTPLRVEKVLSPGVTTFVVIHPLRPGHYPFFDEFNPQLPEGGILAK